MMNKQVKLLQFRILVMVALLGILFGCGNTKNMPDGSSITFSPSAIALTNTSSDIIQNITIVTRYQDGTPMPYAIVHISGPAAVPSLASAYQFYYYPDGTNNASNIKVDSGFDVQTDKSGVYQFSIVVFSGTGFTDTIRAESGTTSATASLSVSAT